MVLHDLLEVVAVVAGAQVAGGKPPPLAFIEEPHGGHVLPKGDALRAAVLLALGALPLQAAEPEPVLAPVLQPALPAGGVDIALHFFAGDAADGGGDWVRENGVRAQILDKMTVVSLFVQTCHAASASSPAGAFTL